MVKFRWETEFRETEIGEIPKDWEIKRMEELISSILKGKTPIKKYKNEGNFPYLTTSYLRGEEEPSEFYPEHAGYLVDDGEVIVLWDGSNSGEVFLGKRGILASTMAKLLFKDEVNTYYVYQALKSIEDDIKSAKSGTDDRHVDKEYFITLQIPFPNHNEQSRISTVLSWFDDLIENMKKQNEILEKTAMAIFKSWFIDFEPFKDEEFVYNEELGREIPKGWEVKAIGEVAEIRSGISYSGKEKFEEPVEGSYIFITLNNTVEGGGFKPVYAWIKSDKIKECHFIREEDIIIPNTEQTKDERLLGSPGIVFFPPDYKLDKGVYSMDIVRIMPTKYFYKYYLYLHLYFTREETATFHTGTSILHFDIRNFKKNKFILIPPQAVLEKFNNLIEPLFKKIILNQKQIMTLKKVRDTLLPLLVFGKLRVEEI